MSQLTKFCRYCGTKIPRVSKSCEKCGANLEIHSRILPLCLSTSGAADSNDWIIERIIGVDKAKQD